MDFRTWFQLFNVMRIWRVPTRSYRKFHIQRTYLLHIWNQNHSRPGLSIMWFPNLVLTIEAVFDRCRYSLISSFEGFFFPKSWPNLIQVFIVLFILSIILLLEWIRFLSTVFIFLNGYKTVESNISLQTEKISIIVDFPYFSALSNVIGKVRQ